MTHRFENGDRGGGAAPVEIASSDTAYFVSFVFRWSSTSPLSSPFSSSAAPAEASSLAFSDRFFLWASSSGSEPVFSSRSST
jgi:hypothetical protein